jgi:hypothetical protein
VPKGGHTRKKGPAILGDARPRASADVAASEADEANNVQPGGDRR